MDVHFTRRPDNGSIAEFDRPDGVRVRLRSYDRTGVVPHDLAHLVVEQKLRLSTGLWGTLAAGGEFGSVEIVSGRLRHDHRARSVALRRANDADLRMAERVVGAVLAVVEGRGGDLDHHVRSAWVHYRPGTDPPPSAAGAAAVDDLLGWAPRWAALGPADRLTLTWGQSARLGPSSRRRWPAERGAR